jgi:glycosyltransferase involved in cell wall biosynthesis
LRFSIVTPSYRSSQWLRLCIASVADQQGVQFEHIVQDSCSDDGTLDWLPGDPRVKAFVEKDAGMYDAINRGFRRATGDILAYLNCDEQYLPGALQAVRERFEAEPSTDVVLADTIVTGSAGDYVCTRFSLRPAGHQMWVRFPVLSCALFARRRVVHILGLNFDPQWRALGDWFWVKEMVDRRLRFSVLPRVTSLFTDTGNNLCLSPSAQREREEKWRRAPRWIKLSRLAILLEYRLQLTARGALSQQPFDYSIYTLNNPSARVTRHAARPTSFWKRGASQTEAER